MNLQQQVTSVEISNKIHKLGITSPSLFFRDSTRSEEYQIDRWSGTEGDYSPDNVNCYTVAELGEILPSNIHQFEKNDSDPNGKWFSSSKTDDNTWVAGYGENSTNEVEFEANTEADARGAMLVYLIENKLI